MDVLAAICSPDYLSSDTEFASKGSDKEARDFSSESESDDEGQQPDIGVSINNPHAGIPIRKHSFSEEDPNFNLYAPFRDSVDYRLACFFNSAKTSKEKIEQFFCDGILKSLNPTHEVQFHSAYIMYKLVDAAANEPRWHSGMVNYPLLLGVQFHDRNIISAVEYLLCQKPYASDLINTAKWWEETQELLPDRGTLVPILLASDETHLTNFSGDKKL
ncbi:hypothetical protein BGX38DRAFT_1278901 [Terfezia claveryi]|nr:hypothetical protein BGX38DRAFT_1278901 [Terfezia claveryi]